MKQEAEAWKIPANGKPRSREPVSRKQAIANSKRRWIKAVTGKASE